MFGNYSLQLCNNGKPVFSSKGKWLYPLFELEQFLISSSLDPKKAELHDKIVGRAAALLIIRMGIGVVHAEILSKLGEEILIKNNTKYMFDRRVEKIICRTEKILCNINNPDEAHEILLRKAFKKKT